LFALFGEINDVLNIDTFGSWFLDGDDTPVNWWPEILADQGINLYTCDGSPSGVCEIGTRSYSWQLLTGSRMENTIRDDLYRGRGIVNAYPCSFPGLFGSLITAGVVHYHFSAALSFDFVSDLTLPTYMTFNDAGSYSFDPVFRNGPNGLNGCLPWRLSRVDDTVDSPCCSAALGGACGCATNPYASAFCYPEYNENSLGLCENYLDWGIYGSANALMEWYTNGGPSNPASLINTL
jgi:hypothetical protein